MRNLTVGATLVLALTTLACDTPAAPRTKPVCSEATFSPLPDVRIVSVSAATDLTPHCKVAGVIGTETNFALLLPDDWNGKFVMGGGGGFVGSVVNRALAYGALQAGYATAGTDTGHRAYALDASWALHNLERIVSFGHQAVHRTAVTARALTSAYYGQDASRNYFIGCSRGGGQALMEAQRYPEDFDGIVAGAPAYDWTNELGARNTWINQAMYPNPRDLSEAVISPEEAELIGKAVLDRCDSLDGLADGILSDPLQCKFDVSSLACGGSTTDACLGAPEVEAARRIYAGPRDQQGQIFPGYPPGGELSAGGWARWLTGGLDLQRDTVPSDMPPPDFPSLHFAFGNGVMRYLVYHDPDWSYADYSVESFRSDAAPVAATLNATNPDLSAFRERGGKLLMYTGWGDMALSPLGTIDYYQRVLEHDASAAEDVRLFMMPGVDHCGGGVGPDWVDYLAMIDAWLETGGAPTHATASWRDAQGQGTGSRPICAYPKFPKYDGSGDPKDAASFACQDGR